MMENGIILFLYDQRSQDIALLVFKRLKHRLLGIIQSKT